MLVVTSYPLVIFHPDTIKSYLIIRAAALSKSSRRMFPPGIGGTYTACAVGLQRKLLFDIRNSNGRVLILPEPFGFTSCPTLCLDDHAQSGKGQKRPPPPSPPPPRFSKYAHWFPAASATGVAIVLALLAKGKSLTLAATELEENCACLEAQGGVD